MYPPSDINFVFVMEYDIDIESTLKINYVLSETRFYQQKLRNITLQKYNNKCIISGVDRILCLEVAHIKPVADCSVPEKMDPENVLLLWIDLHKYFDNYSFSINPEKYVVTVCHNHNITNEEYNWLKQYDGLQLDKNVFSKSYKYFVYHYKIFSDNITNNS